MYCAYLRTALHLAFSHVHGVKSVSVSPICWLKLSGNCTRLTAEVLHISSKESANCPSVSKGVSINKLKCCSRVSTNMCLQRAKAFLKTSFPSKPWTPLSMQSIDCAACRHRCSAIAFGCNQLNASCQDLFYQHILMLYDSMLRIQFCVRHSSRLQACDQVLDCWVDLHSRCHALTQLNFTTYCIQT